MSSKSCMLSVLAVLSWLCHADVDTRERVLLMAMLFMCGLVVTVMAGVFTYYYVLELGEYTAMGVCVAIVGYLYSSHVIRLIMHTGNTDIS